MTRTFTDGRYWSTLPDGSLARPVHPMERLQCSAYVPWGLVGPVPCDGKAVVERRTAVNPQGTGGACEPRCVEHSRRTVDAYIGQAERHGHPDWSHLFAFGPCTREDWAD